MVVFLSSLGQVLLKGGVSGIAFKGGLNSLLSFALDCAKNYVVVLGLLCYALGAFLWLLVLKLSDLSVAYPMISLTYPIVVFFSFLLFGETITLRQLIGIVAIMLGVSLVYR
ncbi:MAG: EamA family transporter [Synergistetes bacterium]|nr:MAG: putative transporter protein [bacterium 42_11]MBC7332506.1 EamA family transporter [Synergistota bacterium]MDK2871841.1 hypothetical protein [bacterium]